MACMDRNDIRPEQGQAPLRYVYPVEDEASIHYRCVGCIHCGICVDSCPADAIRRNPAAFVEIVTDRCIGCGNCVAACPLHVITLQQGRAVKCDGCSDRMQAGLLPACVHTCPTGALELRE